MFLAILLQTVPYFADSSMIACSARSKNNSMILLSSNKAPTPFHLCTMDLTVNLTANSKFFQKDNQSFQQPPVHQILNFNACYNVILCKKCDMLAVGVPSWLPDIHNAGL